MLGVMVKVTVEVIVQVQIVCTRLSLVERRSTRESLNRCGDDAHHLPQSELTGGHRPRECT